MCCVSAANLDGEGSDEVSQSVSGGDHDPPSPEPESPKSSSPDLMVCCCFHTAVVLNIIQIIDNWMND